jgi:hypothetical protein
VDGFGEVLRLAADLTGAANGAEVARNAEKALKFTSVQLKRDWQQGAERTGLTGYAASIDFDIKHAAGEISSEIGPNLGRNQGSFGFVEEGGSKVRSQPQHAGRDSLEANEPDFYRGMEIAVFDALTKAVGK